MLNISDIFIFIFLLIFITLIIIINIMHQQINESFFAIEVPRADVIYDMNNHPYIIPVTWKLRNILY